MRNKKGASAVVAWVLLLGFSIGLATTIFLWTTRQTEEMSESAVRFVEGGMQCDNVMINVINTSHASCDGNPNCCLKITNTRYLNIENIILQGLNEVKSYDCNKQLKVKEPNNIIFCGQNWAAENVTVMPIIKVNEDLVACKNKAITVEC